MRLNKEKLQRLTYLGKDITSPTRNSNENTFYYTQKLGWLSKPSTRNNSVQKRSKSKDKVLKEQGNGMKKQNKSVRSTFISRCGSFDLTQPMTPKKESSKAPEGLSRRLFKFHWKIGSGAFGKVWKVEEKKTHAVYAMKQISKATVLVKKSIESIMSERALLSQLNNPFVINMKYAFQDIENLYIALDYLSGGDLRYHLFTKVNFSQPQCKFIISCIILSLQYLRQNNVIHRDLKPENLVFESSGYLRLTDFGVARIAKNNNSKETSGTPGYMAPEVLCHMNHSFEADYYALGVIAYEIVTKKRPYCGSSRKQIREMVLSKEVTLKKHELPVGYSEDILDFINKLIVRNKDKRLGQKSFAELKKHPWLSSVNWSSMRKKQVKPPFVPKNTCEEIDYLQQLQTEEVDNNAEELKLLLRNGEIQKLFKDYNFPLQSKSTSYNISHLMKKF